MIPAILLFHTHFISLDPKSLQGYSQRQWLHGSRPFHDLTGTIPSFWHSNHAAVNGGNRENLQIVGANETVY